MSIENVELLKKEVENVFGRKILSSSDCQYLANDIHQQTDFKISVNTLRRLFNLMKSKYMPSLFTLDLLSKYCNYSSYSDFISPKADAKNSPDSDLELRFLNLLIFLFKDMHNQGVNEATYTRFIHEVITTLAPWPGVVDRFQREIAKTQNGQNIYYEHFINIDELNKVYGKGLQYYLREKRTDEAQLFGHSLLCLNSWLTMNNDGVKRHGSQVASYITTKETTIDAIIQARVFATRLYAADIDNEPVNVILMQARKYHAQHNFLKHQRQNYQSFEYIMAEALILIKEYSEAIFYIDEVIDNEQKNMYLTNDGFKQLESMYLFKAIALAHLGELKKSKEILDAITTNNFYFLSKQFNLILYLSLKQRFKSSDALQYQIDYCIKQTGFKRLIINDKCSV